MHFEFTFFVIYLSLLSLHAVISERSVRVNHEYRLVRQWSLRLSLFSQVAARDHWRRCRHRHHKGWMVRWQIVLLTGFLCRQPGGPPSQPWICLGSDSLQPFYWCLKVSSGLEHSYFVKETIMTFFREIIVYKMTIKRAITLIWC